VSVVYNIFGVFLEIKKVHGTYQVIALNPKVYRSRKDKQYI